MPALVAVGAQWGDEGKGKVVDWIAAQADVVVRFHGGNNAGHTLWVEGEKTVLHVVPAGVLQPGTTNVIGPGVVVDPVVQLGEIDELTRRGVLKDPSRVRVSGRAHVIFPWNCSLDKARDEARKERAIGTTGRGIGPTYEDKVARRGIRVADLLEAESLRGAVDELAAAKNRELRDVHGWPTVDADELYRALREGKNVLFEGAQGTFLDIDHGTYPYVTSSNCVAGTACTGAGVGPTRIERVLGITKAYTTRVGGGPFPTEETGEAGENLRAAGDEFGATTGRPRRCGWLDAVMLREAAVVNGFTGLALNKMDVLRGQREIPIATAYRVDGKLTHDFPMTLNEVERAEPVYETWAGFSQDVRGVRRFEDLPDAARRYVDRVEALAGVPVELISVGPGRDETVVRTSPF